MQMTAKDLVYFAPPSTALKTNTTKEIKDVVKGITNLTLQYLQ